MTVSLFLIWMMTQSPVFYERSLDNTSCTIHYNSPKHYMKLHIEDITCNEAKYEINRNTIEREIPTYN